MAARIDGQGEKNHIWTAGGVFFTPVWSPVLHIKSSKEEKVANKKCFEKTKNTYKNPNFRSKFTS